MQQRNPKVSDMGPPQTKKRLSNRMDGSDENDDGHPQRCCENTLTNQEACNITSLLGKNVTEEETLECKMQNTATVVDHGRSLPDQNCFPFSRQQTLTDGSHVNQLCNPSTEHQRRQPSQTPIEAERSPQVQTETTKSSNRPLSRGKKRRASEMDRIADTIETQGDYGNFSRPRHSVRPNIAEDGGKGLGKQSLGNDSLHEQLDHYMNTKRFKGNPYDKFDLIREVEMRERAKDETFIQRLKEELLKRIRKIEKLEKDLEAETEFLQDAKTENEYLEDNVGSLKSRSAELEAQLASRIKDHDRLESETEQQKQKLVKKTEKLAEVEEELQNTRVQLIAAETRMNEIEKQLVEKSGLAAEARNESCELKAQLKTAIEDFKSLVVNINEGKMEILGSLTSSKDHLTLKLSERKDKSEEVMQSLKDLQNVAIKWGEDSIHIDRLQKIVEHEHSRYSICLS